MVERELPKLNTRVRFPSPAFAARSLRATARQAPLVAAPINKTYPKGESVAPKGRVSGPEADQPN